MGKNKYRRGDKVRIVKVPRGVPKHVLGKTGEIWQIGNYPDCGGFAYHVKFPNGLRAIFNARHLVPSKQLVDMISEIFGLKLGLADEIFESAKTNYSLLANCDRPHNFVPCGKAGKPFTKQRCTKCGGVVSDRDARYYNQGLKDGAKDAE